MKTKNLALVVLILCVALLASAILGGCNYVAPEYADVYVTTGTMSKLLARQTSLQFTDYTEDDEYFGTSVVVDVSKQKQEFYGYGATLTHASAYLLMQDGAQSTADEILQELFGEDGARLNLVRIPVGASDYIEGDTFFTCCDIDDVWGEDKNLDNFSIAKDVNIIAVLKKIIALNPNVKIFACPWSAPAWMKTGHNLILKSELSSDYFDTYADYLVKFVEAYKAEGIDIDYMSLVNEPFVGNVGYPCMEINELDAIDVSRKLSKKLSEKNLDVKLLGYEHNAGDSALDYVDMTFKTNYLDGVAFHGYTDVKVATVAEMCQYVSENYSGKEMFLTEITEHSGSNDFASNLAYAARYTTIDPLNYGLNGSMFWNLVLRSDGTPTPVSHNTACYGVIDFDCDDDGNFSYFKRSAWYAMAHVGKFAYQIDGKYPVSVQTSVSNDSLIVATALYRADGAVVVTVVNVNDQLSETVHVVLGGKKVSLEVQPQSVVTFVC